MNNTSLWFHLIYLWVESPLFLSWSLTWILIFIFSFLHEQRTQRINQERLKQMKPIDFAALLTQKLEKVIQDRLEPHQEVRRSFLLSYINQHLFSHHNSFKNVPVAYHLTYRLFSWVPRSSKYLVLLYSWYLYLAILRFEPRRDFQIFSFPLSYSHTIQLIRLHLNTTYLPTTIIINATIKRRQHTITMDRANVTHNRG